jgi:hypothetical protein
MATSGQLNTNTAYDSYFWVKWSQVSQDIAGNKTKISWSCGVTCGHSFYSNAIKMSAVSINGVQVYAGGTYSNFEPGENLIANGDMYIDHGTDGSKSFTISPFTGWLYANYNYSSKGKSYELTKIPRQATLTAAPDFTDLENPTISYSNPAGNSVDALKACISLTGAIDDIWYREIDKETSSYTFNLTDAEREVLRNNTSGLSRTVTFFVRTTIGNSNYYSALKKTLTIADSDATRPSVSMNAALNNGSLPDKFAGLWIQGKSRVGVALSATGKYGAGIRSYSAQVDGNTYRYQTFTSDAIQSAGNVKIIGYAKDSREFTGSAEQTVNVIEYSKPLVIPLSSENAIQCYRSDGNGNRTGDSTSLWIKAKRSYYRVNGKNTCALQWRWKPATEQWNDSSHSWRDLRSKTSTEDSYNALLPNVEFDLRKSYTIQIRTIDDIGEQDIKTLDVPTRDVALHLGRGGKNVSVGSYCDYTEDYTFHCEWKAIFDSDIVIKGMTLAEYIKSVIN